jgi:hypothetical protein
VLAHSSAEHEIPTTYLGISAPQAGALAQRSPERHVLAEASPDLPLDVIRPDGLGLLIEGQ